MAIPGKWKRDRPKRRDVDAVVKDMKSAGVQEKDTQDRIKWWQKSAAATPRNVRKNRKEKTVPNKYICAYYTVHNLKDNSS